MKHDMCAAATSAPFPAAFRVPNSPGPVPTLSVLSPDRSRPCQSSVQSSPDPISPQSGLMTEKSDSNGRLRRTIDSENYLTSRFNARNPLKKIQVYYLSNTVCIFGRISFCHGKVIFRFLGYHGKKCRDQSCQSTDQSFSPVQSRAGQSQSSVQTGPD